MANERPSKRMVDVAVIAPILGLVLMIPPVIGLFATDRTVFGAPLILVYLFGVWLGLIALAAIIARKLSQSAKDDPT
jgi:hypothetical protein